MSSTDREEVILRALRAAETRPVSGETLAASLGVSRVAVGKRIAALRERGYAIEAVGGQGYRLLSSPDLPLPAEVTPLLRSRCWTHLTGGGSTASTNDDAKSLARAGAPAGTVVLASEQTGGRGRLGRAWASPPGGVYLSALLRPALAPAELAPLPLVAGIAVARAAESLGAESRLKWPNDVYCPDGRKLAGILVEMAAESDRVAWVVVGIGLNVRPPEGERMDLACYLAEAVESEGGAPRAVLQEGKVPGRPPVAFPAPRAPSEACPSMEPLPRSPRPSLAEVAARVLDALATTYDDFARDGFDGALRAEYERRSWLAGRDVTVRDATGATRAAGRVAGVDETGRLVVEAAEGRVAVAAGEVTLRHDVE